MSSAVAGSEESVPLDGLAGLEVCRPGGPELSAELRSGAGVGQGSRIVQLVPGFGETTREIAALSPRELTCVAPTPLAAKVLARAIPGAETVVAPPAATGLPERSASAVVGECVLTPLGDEERGAVLAEAARLLRSGGRVAFHELCLRPQDPRADLSRARAELAEVGLHPLDADGWRAVLRDSELVPVGATSGPLVERGTPATIGERGMRATLATLDVARRDRHLLQRAMRAQATVRRWRDVLGGIVVVGEKALIAGMRRPG